MMRMYMEAIEICKRQGRKTGKISDNFIKQTAAAYARNYRDYLMLVEALSDFRSENLK